MLDSDSVIVAIHPNFAKFESLLSPGWVPGRKVDNSDQQYACFRYNIKLLLFLLVLHPTLRRGFERIYQSSTSANGAVTSHESIGKVAGIQSSEADRRLNRRVSFDLYFAVIYIFALHGSSAFKIFLILYVNFTLATRLNKEYVPVTTWAFNIGVLFANEIFKGYPYAGFVTLFHSSTDPARGSELQGEKQTWALLLDSFGGLLPRWEILFNITVLRLISFNLDYYWSSGQSESGGLEVCLNN